jgi:hypothetical protein
MVGDVVLEVLKAREVKLNALNQEALREDCRSSLPA